MGTSISQRVQKHRDGLRAAGMRLVQIWVPDTRRQAFSHISSMNIPISCRCAGPQRPQSPGLGAAVWHRSLAGRRHHAKQHGGLGRSGGYGFWDWQPVVCAGCGCGSGAGEGVGIWGGLVAGEFEGLEKLMVNQQTWSARDCDPLASVWGFLRCE